MILPVYLYGQPVLRKVAEDISKDYEGLERLLTDMWESMYKSDGVGLAAPQIGVPIRLLLIDGEVLGDDFPECKGFKRVMINARITSFGGDKVTLEEGCLSLPGINEAVSRPTSITVTYQNEKFEEIEEEIVGFAARIVQHEYDHLEGKLFIDHISPIRKQLIKAKLNNILKGKVNCNYRTKTQAR